MAQNNTMQNSSKIYDVVIIGAGPVGLATAVGLRQRGIENILVIDQTRAFRQVGQVLDILPNGLKALKQLDVNAYTALKNNAIKLPNTPNNSRQWLYKDYQGQLIRSLPLDFDYWVEHYGEGRLSMSWFELQTTLRNQLPPEMVKSNHRCINLVDEPENDCVRVECVSDGNVEDNPYAYWENNTKSTNNSNTEATKLPPKLISKTLRGKIIIGADGINSNLRKIIYKDTQYSKFAQPEYSGFAAILCREIKEIPEQLQTEIYNTFLKDTFLTSIGNNRRAENYPYVLDPTMMLFSREMGKFGYIIHLPISLASLQNKAGNKLIDLAVQQLEKSNFPNSLKELVKNSPAENMQQRPYYIHHASHQTNNGTVTPPWNKKRVVLVGDAAHGMPPFMAQGANQGLEDALVITTIIDKIAKQNYWYNFTEISQKFAQYENLRRSLIAYVQTETLTRLPQISEQKWYEFSQKVYNRDLTKIVNLV